MLRRRTRITRLALLAATFALAACGDGSGPAPVLRVTATANVEGVPSVLRLDDGTPYLQCAVRVRAEAQGTGTGEWLGAKLRWFYGTARTPFDSVEIGAFDVRAGWDEGEDIVVGQARTSHWRMSATIPFDGEIELRYRREGGDRESTTTAAFRCGPPIPPGAAAPEVTNVTVATPTSPLERGDTLVVTFTATSPAALWRSAVVLDGPCEAVIENVEPLATSVTRTVKVPVPFDCALGSPMIEVGALVLDGAGRTAVRGVGTGLRVVDVTPPTLTPMFFLPSGGSTLAGPAGLYFVGDSVLLNPNAGDTGGVQWLVWEVLPGGARDSLLVTGGFATAKLPVRASWSTGTTLRITARDYSGNTSAPFDASLASMRVLPSATRASRTMSVTGEIRDAVVDPKRNVVYLLQTNERRIRVVDVATMSVVRTIDLELGAVGMDLTAGGDSLLVGLQASARALGVIDLRAATPAVTQIPLPSIDPALSPLGPQQVLAMANGHAFVQVWGQSAAGWQLIDVDLAAGTSRVRTDADAAGTTLVRSLDRRVLVLQGSGGQFRRWTTASDAFTSAPAPARANGPLAIDGTGATTATNRFLYDAGLAFTRQAQSPFGDENCFCGVPVALSPDGANLFFLVGGGLVRARTSDGMLMDRATFTLPPTMSFATQSMVLAWPGSDRLVVILSRIEGTTGSGAVVVME